MQRRSVFAGLLELGDQGCGMRGMVGGGVGGMGREVIWGLQEFVLGGFCADATLQGSPKS